MIVLDIIYICVFTVLIYTNIRFKYYIFLLSLSMYIFLIYILSI